MPKQPETLKKKKTPLLWSKISYPEYGIEYRSYSLSDELDGYIEYLSTHLARIPLPGGDTMLTYRAFILAVKCVSSSLEGSSQTYHSLKTCMENHLGSCEYTYTTPLEEFFTMDNGGQGFTWHVYKSWRMHILHNYLTLLLIAKIIRAREYPAFSIPKSIKAYFAVLFRKLNAMKDYLKEHGAVDHA